MKTFSYGENLQSALIKAMCWMKQSTTPHMVYVGDEAIALADMGDCIEPISEAIPAEFRAIGYVEPISGDVSAHSNAMRIASMIK